MPQYKIFKNIHRCSVGNNWVWSKYSNFLWQSPLVDCYGNSDCLLWVIVCYCHNSCRSESSSESSSESLGKDRSRKNVFVALLVTVTCDTRVPGVLTRDADISPHVSISDKYVHDIWHVADISPHVSISDKYVHDVWFWSVKTKTFFVFKLLTSSQ